MSLYEMFLPKGTVVKRTDKADSGLTLDKDYVLTQDKMAHKSSFYHLNDDGGSTYRGVEYYELVSLPEVIVESYPIY
jgi:hypothetical protein